MVHICHHVYHNKIDTMTMMTNSDDKSRSLYSSVSSSSPPPLLLVSQPKSINRIKRSNYHNCQFNNTSTSIATLKKTIKSRRKNIHIISIVPFFFFSLSSTTTTSHSLSFSQYSTPYNSRPRLKRYRHQQSQSNSCKLLWKRPSTAKSSFSSFIHHHYYHTLFSTTSTSIHLSSSLPLSSNSDNTLPNSQLELDSNNMNNPFTKISNLQNLKQPQLLQLLLSKTIPNLTPSSHKGSSGRIGIIGGSDLYTGAPYYTAMSSLRTGSDLVYLFCSNAASTVIKSYSPELMVQGVYDGSEVDALSFSFSTSIHHNDNNNNNNNNDDGESNTQEQRRQKKEEEIIQSIIQNIQPQLDKLHALVVGPGLGRNIIVFKAIYHILKIAIYEKSIPCVLDADAIYMISTHEEFQDLLFSTTTTTTTKKKKKNHLNLDNQDTTNNDHNNPDRISKCPGLVILTPNIVEYQRLVTNLSSLSDPSLLLDDTKRDTMSMKEELFQQTCETKSTVPIVIIKKGQFDTISCFNFSSTNNNHSVDTMTTTTTTMICDEKGGLKRSGGLGDILAGMVGTFAAWNQILCSSSSHSIPSTTTTTTSDTSHKSVQQNDILLSCWLACCFTKRATNRAFQKRKRSMTAPDVLEEIGSVVDDISGSLTLLGWKNDDDDDGNFR